MKNKEKLFLGKKTTCRMKKYFSLNLRSQDLVPDNRQTTQISSEKGRCRDLKEAQLSEELIHQLCFSRGLHIQNNCAK